MPTTVDLRPEDRAALRHARAIRAEFPQLRLRLDWLAARLGATHLEVVEIRHRLKAAGLWEWEREDDYRKPSSKVRLRAEPGIRLVRASEGRG